ncbi:UBC-like protein [Westerdykella ornata]|uniref:UBC-like protein n=1 Tax=Westerdykella ornata TaxID=318751 RepID=A0A6A6JSI7_WESOR|nr:UBC-like protein [Westerdykella ornata]KAF2278696.1 UBC-like protein [Westerdykella ornata]
MSTRGTVNTKRILKEASEFAANASPDYHAEPLEDNLFEWHFTIKGPPAPSPYDGGIYHGRIILPAQYPLRPPSFRFLTPTGRFEVNREICLSISDHHEETWQPAWGIRTALVALRSFMDTDAKGQLGGIECTQQARKKMAVESRLYKCAVCAKSNAEIIKEREEAAALQEAKEGKRKEEEIPEELRLAYRDELNKESEADGQQQKEPKGKEKAHDPSEALTASTPATGPAVTPAAKPAAVPIAEPVPRPTATVQAPVPQQAVRVTSEPSLAWVDACIYAVVAALIFMVLRKVS